VQSGLYYGYLGLVDGILERLLAELGAETKVVATGGLASLMASGSRYISAVDELLTLDGLRILWERNAAPGRARPAAAPPQEKPAAPAARKRSSRK
jgi:type III pantothenate kinase